MITSKILRYLEPLDESERFFLLGKDLQHEFRITKPFIQKGAFGYLYHCLLEFRTIRMTEYIVWEV